MLARPVRSLALTLFFAPIALTACGGNTVSPGGNVRTTDTGFTTSADTGVPASSDATVSTAQDSGTAADTGTPRPDAGTGGPTDTGVPQNPADAGVVPTCTYPAGSVEPMQLDQIISPYAWLQAEDIAANVTRDLDFRQVYCNTDPDLDWGGIDYLLLVSVPAW